MAADRVALIDWDEAHVDAPDLDLPLPFNAAKLEAGALDKASQASAAWEAAVCWKDDYAVRRLAEVRAIRSNNPVGAKRATPGTDSVVL